MKLAALFAGFVDHREGQTVGGWAVDRNRPDIPCDIDIYADAHLVQRARADILRPDLVGVSPIDQRKGFLVDVASKLEPGSHVEVFFGNTSVRIPPTLEVAARMGRSPIDLHPFSRAVSNRWVPVPPASMITHITQVRGTESELQEIYRETGSALAADICNIPLELGVDLDRSKGSFVDLGCGCGRVATFLAPWFEHIQFLGVDVWKPGITWATEHITGKYETYRFHCLVSGGEKYQGHAVYRIPVEDGRTDYVISTSLFTHLAVDACDGYLREISRILKPGGLAYTTFFIRDEQSIGGPERLAKLSNRPLITEAKASYCGRGEYLDICHDRERVSSVAAKVGLQPVLFRRGAWRGIAFSSVNPAAYQDLIVFQKLGSAS